jgi:hypothetical protein
VSFTYREAIRENIHLLIGLAGSTGGGKTYSALRLATGLARGGPVFGIDTENGRMLHYADQFKFQHGRLDAPYRPGRYLDAIVAAEKAGAAVIVVDSASHEHAGEGGLLDWHDELVGTELTRKRAMCEKNGWPFDEWKEENKANMGAWIEPKTAHKGFVQKLLQVNAHVILCFRAEAKVEMVKNDKGKMEIRPKESPVGAEGYMPIAEKTLPFEMTLSLLFTADDPGVPKPIKLEAQHRPFVDLKQPVNERTGELLAEWAAGGIKQETKEDMSLQHILIAIKVAENDEHIQALTPHVKKLSEADQGKARDAAIKRKSEFKAR